MANNDLINSLKGMLGDNADEKINSVLNILKNNNNDNQAKNIEDTISSIENDITTDIPSNLQTNSSLPISPESLNYISKIKDIVDEMSSANDPRSNLLMSLRPYMRDSRKRSIDNAVKILNLSRFSGLFNI